MTPAPQQTASTAPLSRAAKDNDDDEILVDEHDQRLRTLAILGVYRMYCGELPPDMDRNAAAQMQGAGEAQMMPHVMKVERVRQRLGNGSFCAFVRKSLRIALQ
jgi:hypothetical protein